MLRRRTVLIGASVLLPGAAPVPAGHVEEVRGIATGERAEERRRLVPPDSVFIGEQVVTGADSRANLLLGRDTAVRMGANARLRIDRYVVNAGGELTLGDGSFLIDKSPGPALRMRAAFGLITVRGTRVWAGPDNGTTGIFVAHGIVEVEAGGQRVTLRDGEGSDIAAPGAAPTAPHRWGQARIDAALASVT